MIVVGLTGSIGMGKSTTARMFAERGVPVWDADAAVARLYGPGGEGTAAIAALAPEAAGPGGVDRAALRRAILADETLLARIEAAIHPLVARDREAFLERHRSEGAAVVLCDIPLLFETGADAWLDRVIVVTAPAAEQRRRVLSRAGMTRESFEAILAKQVPDAEKRARADYVIDTGEGIAAAERQVEAVLADILATRRE